MKKDKDNRTEKIYGQRYGELKNRTLKYKNKIKTT